MFRRILVPLDGSVLAEQALPYARALARVAQGGLALLHVTSDTALQRQPMDEIMTADRIEELVEQLRWQGLKAASQVAHGDPAQAIVDVVSRSHGDLIAMSTQGRSGLGRWLYGSVTDEVLRRSPVPVLLVPAACDDAWPEDRPLELMVPLDGSDLAEAALGPARQLRDALGANLLLERTVEPSLDDAIPVDPAHLSIQLPASGAIDEAREYLEGLSAGPLGVTRSIDVLVDTGDPSMTVAATARREGVDLIVMATHGRTGLARLALGSVATATLQRANVPVLLVRPARIQRASEAPAASATPAGTNAGTRQ